MRRHLNGALKFLAVPTVAFVVVAAFAPGRAGLALRIYALLVCGTALALALIALRAAFPPEPRPPEDRAERPARRRPPSSLARVEHEVALGVAGSFDLHFLLVPRLRSIASGLLESRRKLSLERQPEEARRVLGDATWMVVRPDRPAPDDRLARGIRVEELTDVVDSLEGV